MNHLSKGNVVFVLSGTIPTDMELMSSMMQKISLLEQKIDKQVQEIQLKVKVLALTRPVQCPDLPFQARVMIHSLRHSLGYKLIHSLLC